ncbi:MAG: type IV pilus assembly protein PilM [Candidatus Saccharibacteria bacterium]|nr:type IV pilus assembly protein PilM [Candidatus Saccharibacteria bacterium]
MNTPLLYKDKPIFGIDIGFSSVKVMQLRTHGKNRTVTGYGVAQFDENAIKDGVITDPESIAKSTLNLFKNKIVGDITSHRVTVSIPATKAFSRTMQLPKLSPKELAEAVRSEAEQYIPLPINDLYIDHEITRRRSDGVELLVVAVPKKVVDSYTFLMRLLGLEVVAIETTIGSGSRLFLEAEKSDVPTVLLDYGSISSDITIFDKSLIVTGTVPGGGDSFTHLIADKLGVTKQEAHVIKTKYGLGVSKKQKEIISCLKPLLDQLIKEVRRNVRYYEERAENDKKIGQIVTMGGGANMPGLSDYMTDQLRLPVRMCDPWDKITFDKLQPPHEVERSMYITAAGLALIKPQEIFA